MSYVAKKVVLSEDEWEKLNLLLEAEANVRYVRLRDHVDVDQSEIDNDKKELDVIYKVQHQMK